MKTNHTRYKEIFPTISLFLEFKELSQMLFSWKFCFETFCPLKKKSVHILSLEVSLEVWFGTSTRKMELAKFVEDRF